MKFWLAIALAALSNSDRSYAKILSPEERMQWCSENLAGGSEWMTVHQYQPNQVTDALLGNLDLFVVLGIRPVQGDFDVLVRGIARNHVNRSGQKPIVVEKRSLNIVRLTPSALRACTGFRNWGKIRLAKADGQLILCDFELKPRASKAR